jgi:hypothetical protein
MKSLTDLLIESGEALYGPQWKTPLARAATTSTRHISRILNGECNLTPSMYRRFAKVFEANGIPTFPSKSLPSQVRKAAPSRTKEQHIADHGGVDYVSVIRDCAVKLFGRGWYRHLATATGLSKSYLAGLHYRRFDLSKQAFNRLVNFFEVNELYDLSILPEPMCDEPVKAPAPEPVKVKRVAPRYVCCREDQLPRHYLYCPFCRSPLNEYAERRLAESVEKRENI